ncbi:hypothetical protein C8F04DRAFT_132456, partial [Mycena alexandri]
MAGLGRQHSFATGEVLENRCRIHLWYPNSDSWLSQANYVFSRLRITSGFEDYLLVDDVYFEIQISAPTAPLPPGFLFVCPVKNFGIGLSSFKWPDCPAYWSRDPLGKERLSAEEARSIGLPAIQRSMTFIGLSWDASVYGGLRQIHRAKGFDPDRQDVVRLLRDTLFQLSCEADNKTVDHISSNSSGDLTSGSMPLELFMTMRLALIILLAFD